jgi:calcineurin-like phosphoesterase family protein
MRQIWLISDTHLGHSNILNFETDGVKVRPEFDNVDQMNDCIMDNLNDMVKPGDILYHLGDVYFNHSKAKKALGHFKALPFKKRLILGNHDNGTDPVLLDIFGKISMWRIFREYNCCLTHVPIHKESFRKFGYNVHGHIHEKPSYGLEYINVCVEKTGYKPVAIEEVMKGKY